MDVSLLILLGALAVSPGHNSSYGGDNVTYYDFPKFWTNSGLCPAGRVTHNEIRESLLSAAMQMNIILVSALPSGAITHLRIHWLLELLEFVQFSQSGLPILDFTDLDEFLQGLNDTGLYPVIEFMGNISDIFVKNPTYNDVIWEDLSFQIAKHYLNMFGAKTVLNWRFETWNEPDLLVYNKIHFKLDDYISYATSVQLGLRRAGDRPENSLHFPLRGPAGLFKNYSHHQLCWGLLGYCNENITQCPIDILTYHRKGNGADAKVIVDESTNLISKIYGMYPSLRQLPISNDEADPISGWSIPRSFQEDVRYATTLLNTVLNHWTAKINRTSLSNLESISHDNAFLSYHPFEFSQRTLLAHFRMNNTDPPHSQFVQKPVYAAVGMLSKLADRASAVRHVKSAAGLQLKILMTMSTESQPIYKSWIIMPFQQDEWECKSNACHDTIPLSSVHLCDKEIIAYIIEFIDQAKTNPVQVWRDYGAPVFPNSTVREEMRLHQSPRILAMGVLKEQRINIDFNQMTAPWILLLRICSKLNGRLKTPHNLQMTSVAQNEVLLTWTEATTSSRCLRSYEVWFRSNDTLEWRYVSYGWHLPFPSFQYAPTNGTSANGFYKVRGRDIFNSTSRFSTQVQYIEV